MRVYNAQTNSYETLRAVTTAKTANVSGTSTVIWTPASGQRYRLRAVTLALSANATLAAAGVTTLTLTDGASGTPILSVPLWLPATALTNTLGALVSSVLLPANGYLGTAGNSLYAALSTALSSGTLAVNAYGNEEGPPP